MINNVTLVGRLTKDIELKVTNNNVSTCTFTVACERRFKAQDGTKPCDFISCVAWRQSAEFLNNYAHKGDFVGVSGSIQTRTYDGKNGKVYVTEVVCDQVNLLSPKKDGGDMEKAAKEFAEDNQVGYVEIKSDDLPFY